MLLSNIQEYIKANLVKVILCLIILVLSFFLFRSCQNPEPILQNDKALLEKLQKDSKQYQNIAKVYKDSVKLLNQKKVIIKQDIEKSVTSTKEKLKPVPSLTTKGIANYFQTSYKIPVVITQYGVAVPDTLAKIIISDLIEGQGGKEELVLTKKLLVTEEQENTAKDTIIVNLDKALTKKDSIDTIKNGIIKHAQQSIKVERNKKTFWQVATSVTIGIITYLVIAK